ncbi:MAG TPA: cytochrome c3 family protein [Bryobacteraceae bacterium]|nr:cytochrome c3 family protein [Bryobacteraceae bacterium]HOQ47755.1 cytochrome c3 family protein [Bryobacteraceae bacterium]HPQ14211.1 cytochrome c3 family protein [Bryobacteraceae bacterium]HPU74131.1 cytochrome c3 family protein [Bryobacteraceae bacterium]
MRLLFVLIAISLLPVVAQEKKAADKLTFKAKTGDVTFDHAAHSKRVNEDCKVCHDKLWPESATAPLNYKAAMHRTAETKQISCGFCHRPGGTSFESKGNCNKCHVRGAKKG